MYRNVELIERGALKSCQVKDLGHIVVICGKNNSGKTTLLLAINEGRQFILPEQIDTSKFYYCVRDRQGRVDDTAYRYFDHVPLTEDVWYETDATLFSSRCISEFNTIERYGSSSPHYHDSEVIARFEKHILPKSKIYIGPKRKLELQGTIETSSKVKPSGEGLLNFLFHARNQFEDAFEKKINDEISRLFHLVSGGYQFMIKTEQNNLLTLFFRFEANSWVNADNCGLGLQDLLIMLYFIVAPSHDILLIEEPESHLHPEMQRKLLNVCKGRKAKQFFFSTHSSVFLDLTLVDTILHTEMLDGQIEVSNDTSRAALLDSLGYSVTDNLVSDLIILTEGPTDKPIVEEFMRKMGFYASYSVKIWPLGGDIMAQVDLSVFAERYKIIGLIDKDPGSQDVRQKFIRKCAEMSIECHQLERQAIENYFTVSALKTAFKGQFPDHVTSIDPNIKLETQLGIDVKKNNKRIAEAMTIEDIEGTDFYEFLQLVEKRLKEPT